jgi:TatD DNase family protein
VHVHAARLKGVQGCVAAGVWWDRLEPLLSNYREWIVEKTASAEFFRSLFLAESAFPILASIGLHPMEVAHRWRNTNGQFDITQANADCSAIRATAKKYRDRIWALGETGFDFAAESIEGWINKDELIRAQSYAFHCCSELAHELSLPLIVHSRSAWGYTKNQIEKVVDSKSVRFMIHCFPGSSEDAQWILQRNGFASFGGVLTWPKAKRMKEALIKMPNECLLFETDAPDLAPELENGYRPNRNEPQLLKAIIGRGAEMKGCSESFLANLNMNNIERLLGMN